MRSWTRFSLAFVAILSLTLLWASATPPSRSGDRLAQQQLLASEKQDRIEFDNLRMRISQNEQLTPPEKARLEELSARYREPNRLRDPLDDQGGPDDFGYFFMDNQNGDTASFEWIELCGDNQASDGPTGDDNSMSIALGLTFPFYGTDYTTAYVGTNGVICFTQDVFDYNWEENCVNDPIPDGRYIFPYWDDLYCTFNGGCNNDGAGPWVRYRNFGSYTVIEWRQVSHYSGSSDRYSFEAILYNTGRIKLQYNTDWNDSETPNSALIGLDDQPSAANGLQYRCISNGASQITGGRAIWIFQAAGIPNPVTNLQGQVNGTNVTLNWTDPTTDTNGNPVTIENVQVWLGPVGSGDLIATVNPGAQTYVHVNAPDGNLTYNVRAFNDPYYGSATSVTVLVGNPSYANDFDTDNGDWSDPADGWQWGAPGAFAPHSAPNVWGAGLSGSYPDQANWYVTMDPQQPITNASATVEFWINYSTEDWWDGANFQISIDEGVTWEFVVPETGYPIDPMWNGEPGWSGQSGDWQYMILPIGAWSGEIPQFRFHFETDFSVTMQGFLFDDMIIWGLAPPVFAPVSGTVTLDGGNGNVTQAVVRSNGVGSPQTNPAANGTYTLSSVLVGQRRIIASLAGYHSDTLSIAVPEGGYAGANFIMRRLDPPAPTNFVISVFDTANGILTFNWDDSPDALVDYYNLYRKLRDDDVWNLVQTFVASTGSDTLPGPGIYQYMVTAVDDDVVPPVVESAPSASLEVLFGELPPTHLRVNGNFDDHVRLTWLPPGAQQSIQIFYDDSTSETWYRVTSPNMSQDYFAVRFTPPDTVDYPLPIQTCNVYMERSDPLPNVWLCPDSGGVPDLNNPYMNWQNIGANGDPGWLIAHVDGDVLLEDNSDFWMVWQFPPGLIGPGTGSDASAPDNRSYWTYEFTWPNWNLWTSNDWMARIWAGGEAGWGVVMSVGGPSGYSVQEVPVGMTAPTPEEILKLESNRGAAVGPVRAASPKSKSSAITSGFAAVTESVWNIERPYSMAPALEYQQRPGRNPLDQELLYYIVYRDAIDIAHPTETLYNDFLPENQPHDYYVTGWYDNNVESGPTSTVNRAANMAPGAPSAVNGVSLNNDDIRITWLDPTACANGQPLVDLAGLNVYRDGLLIGTVSPGVQQYIDTPPQSNRTYVWTIRGIDEVPNEGPGASWAGSVVLPWNECPYGWIDITGNGINTGLSFDDETVGPFDIGFPFTFYGNTYNQVWICSNGWITFTSTTSIRYWNAPIPEVAEPNNAVYLFWDDLYLPTGGQVLYLSDVANGRFVVEWDHVPHINGSGDYTMEMILLSDGGISFQYQELNGDINSCTIGVENAAGTDAIMVWSDGTPQGDYNLAIQTAVCFWGPEPEYADVTGTVTLDGGNGNVTSALVAANGISHPQTNPAANGTYTLQGVVVGDRRITATLAGYHTDTLFVTVPQGGYNGANLTLRRLNPPAPTNLTASVNSGNGVVTLDWDNSTDPLVDGYNIYRKLSTDQNWTFDQFVTVSNDFDTLTLDGIWQYAVTAVDDDVVPPAVESPRSNVVVVLYGELPPSNLGANGNFDDRIRLNWLPPGINIAYQLAYDDSSAEAWYSVFGQGQPNGTQDHFAVRFTPPAADTTSYPLAIQTVNLYLQTSTVVPNVWIAPDNGGAPDLDNAYMSWQDVSTTEEPGWLTVSADGQVSLPDDSDFWVAMQFPPGDTGPQNGSDASEVDGRSYWTYEFSWPSWNQWFSHDWMYRVWLGGEPGWGIVLSSGGPSGYSIERVPLGQTAPTAEMIKMANSAREQSSVGPVRTSTPSKAEKSTTARSSFPVALEDRFDQPYSEAPALVYQQRSGRSTLDDVLYYKIYRNATFLANDTLPPYDNIVTSAGENVTYSYYVTAHYDNNQDSPPSNTVQAAANMAPAAPSNVNGNPVGSSQMQISWTDPTLNADGTPCVDLTSVRVYRDGTLIGTVGAGVQTYTDMPPDPMTFYTWTARAIDEIPNEGPGAGFIGAVQSPWATCDYEWVDITGNGINTGLTFDDQTVGPFNIGFPFTYYGTEYTQVWICSNGWITFASTFSARYWNACLPDPEEPNLCLDMFFDDLFLPTGGQVLYLSDVANDRFIVTWDHVPHINGSGDYTMQIIIDSNGGITYNYQELNGTINECTIGVEDAAGGDTSLEIWCMGNGPYQPTAQTSVCFWGGPSGSLEGVVRAFGTNLPIEGVRVEAQQVPEFTFTDAAGFYSLPLEPGTYTICYTHQGHCDTCFANILIEDNNITVRNVTMRAPQADFSVSSLSLATWPTHDVSATFDITNPAGQCPLQFTISDTSAWLSASPVSGTVPSNQSVTITVVGSPQGLPPGTDHQSVLRIDHGALGSPEMIPVSMSISLSADDPTSLPREFALYQNYPNPFNAATSLRFDLPQESRVKIVLFNVVGQAVATVVDASYPAGRHQVQYDASDLPSGMYLMKLEAGSYTAMKKMLLLK